MADEKMVTVTLPASKFVICDEDHGGYKAGHCIACEASGWFPLKHRPGCPVAARGVPAVQTVESPVDEHADWMLEQQPSRAAGVRVPDGGELK